MVAAGDVVGRLAAYAGRLRKLARADRDRAVVGLAEYGAKVRRLTNAHQTRVRSALAGYSQRVRELAPADARRRYEALRGFIDARFGSALGPVLALTHLGGFEWQQSNHAVALAGLLDPKRSGEIARVIWPRLMDLLAFSAKPGMPQAKREQWTSRQGVLRRLIVAPDSGSGALEQRDVWARAMRGRPTDPWDYDAALLIEPRLGGRGDEELTEHYWRRVVNARAADRTTFVLLTREGRIPRWASQPSQRYFLRLSWRELAQMLLEASGDARLSAAQQVVLLQYRSVILQQLYRVGGGEQPLALARKIRQELGDEPDDRQLLDMHMTICDLIRVVVGGGP